MNSHGAFIAEGTDRVLQWGGLEEEEEEEEEEERKRR